MVGSNTLFKLVQTDNSALSACTDYGNESLIINVDGGVYLGNNTTEPIKIADVSQSSIITGTISKTTSSSGVAYTFTNLDDFITPGESRFYIAKPSGQPGYGIPFIISVARVGNVSIQQYLTPLFPTYGAGGDFYEITQGSILRRTGAVSGFNGETFSLTQLSAYDISGLTTVATSGSFADLSNTPTTIAGYGITDAKIENGVITLGGNTITPLTGFTETDPIFTASPACGITSTDIINWDAKADTSDIPTVISELTNDKNYIVANTALTDNRLVIGNNTQTDNGLSTLNNPNGGDKQVLVANSASTPSWEYIGNLTISGNTDTLSDVIPTGTTSANTLVNQVQVIDTIRGINAYYISSNDEMSQGYEYNTQYAGQPIYLEGGPWYKSTLEGIKQCTASTGVYVTVNDYAIVMHDETLLYFSADDFRYQRVKDGGVYGQFGAMRLPDGTLAAITTVTDGTRTGFAFTDASNQTKALHGGSSVEYVMWSLTVTQDAAEQYIGGYVAGATPDDTFDIFLPTARYICTVAQTDSTVPVWSFQYIVSDVSLTSSQLAALNSGINSTKVSNYDSHVTNTNIHVTTAQTASWDAKQGVITTSGTPYGNLNLSNGNVLTIISGPYKNTADHNTSALQNILADNLMMSDYSYLGGSSSISLPQGITSASTASEIKTTWDTTKFSLQKGNSAITHGNNNVNLGNASSVFGNENFNNGETAIISGYRNTNQTQSSAVFGASNQALNGAYGLVAGNNNIVGNSYSLTVGQGLLNGNADGTNNTAWQTVLGKYNVSSGSFIRITGNGTSDNARSNCETLSPDGELWTALDVMCGGLNQWAPTHKLSEKISEAPTGGTMYVRQSADWSAIPNVIPITKLTGTVNTLADLPSAPYFAETVNGDHSHCIFKYYILYQDATSIGGIKIEVSPADDGTTVDTWIRNAENWNRENSTNISIDGTTLADIGYSVDINTYGQGVTAATITLNDSIAIGPTSTMTLVARTWGASDGTQTYNNEYTLTNVTFNFSNISALVPGTSYYVTEESNYYYYTGTEWVPSVLIADHSLLDTATQQVGGTGTYSMQSIRYAINALDERLSAIEQQLQGQ